VEEKISKNVPGRSEGSGHFLLIFLEQAGSSIYIEEKGKATKEGKIG